LSIYKKCAEQFNEYRSGLIHSMLVLWISLLSNSTTACGINRKAT